MDNKNKHELKYIKYLHKCNEMLNIIGGSGNDDDDTASIESFDSFDSVEKINIFKKCNDAYNKNVQLQEYFKILAPDENKMRTMIEIIGSLGSDKCQKCKNMLYKKDHFKLAYAKFVTDMRKGTLFKKFDKKCLGVFTSYQVYSNGIMNRLVGVGRLKSCISSDDTTSYLPLKIENGLLVKSDADLADGTLSLYQPTIDSTLVNVYEVNYKYKEFPVVQTLRYGTPLKKNSFEQCKMISKYLKEKSSRAIIISLLDVCVGACKLVAKDKVEETKIIISEIESYRTNQDVCFFNASINNNVNSGSTSVLKLPNSQVFFKRLEGWINELTLDSEIKKCLIKYLNEIIKIDLSENKSPREIEKNISKDMVQTVSKQKSIKRELVRYYTLCFFCLLQNIFIHFGKISIILAYHCKSGQDRTGTMCAINQTCNYIFSTKFSEIKTKLENRDNINSNINFFRSIFETFFRPMNIISFLQYNLYPSYVITWASTGIPGLKWQLGKTEFGVSIENKFAYILTENVETALVLEGGSNLRGS